MVQSLIFSAPQPLLLRLCSLGLLGPPRKPPHTVLSGMEKCNRRSLHRVIDLATASCLRRQERRRQRLEFNAFRLTHEVESSIAAVVVAVVRFERDGLFGARRVGLRRIG